MTLRPFAQTLSSRWKDVRDGAGLHGAAVLPFDRRPFRASRCEQGKPVQDRRCPAAVSDREVVSRNTCAACSEIDCRGLQSRATRVARGSAARGPTSPMPAPSRLVRSAAAVALATSATGLAYVGSAAPARAAGYNGYCTSGSGVTIVVDFRSLGGGITIRCAPVGGGANGVQALQAAGIPVAGTQRYGMAFVCRLYGKPSADPCVNTPPTNAHWDYWKASNGGSWSYSSTGASQSAVIPGGFEGWSFSTGTRVAPRAAPRRPAHPPAHKPKPAPSHTTTSVRPPARHTTAAASHQSSSTAAPSTSAHRKAASPSSRAVTKSRTGSTSTSAAGASSSNGSTAAVAGGVRLANSDKLINDSTKSSGINATTVVGGIILAVLAVGGGAIAIVRRRSLG